MIGIVMVMVMMLERRKRRRRLGALGDEGHVNPLLKKKSHC